MEAFFFSTGLVALAEIGDKTQLLALVLATRYRRPLPIILGILVATLANHFLAGALGRWLASTIDPGVLRIVLGASFIAMAVWALIPDRYEEQKTAPARLGIFVTTVIAFFLLEMGDKTQIATVAMAVKYDSLAAVVAGSTLGMMLANVPAVLLGDVAAKRLPLKWMRGAAALLLFGMGIAILTGL